MGFKSRSAGEPLSILRTEASVLVAKNWKMVSMHLALISSQSRKPNAYAAQQASIVIDSRYMCEDDQRSEATID